MTDAPPEPSPTTARRIARWQMLFFAALLAASALGNGYTVLADHARGADPLPTWKPFVWEFTSHALVWLLIPPLSWMLGRFPLSRDCWWRSLPVHLVATLPFSVLHVEGMVLLRRAVYRLVGERYEFGPFWSNWPYEYRKDVLTYALLLGALLAFRVYGLWLDARAAGQARTGRPDPPSAAPALDRLVVRKRNREFILDVGDIDRIESDGNYVVVHAAGESYRLRESLDALARRLGEQRFARIHRTHVVNIDRIREIQPWDHGDYRIVLKDGSFLSFSRRYRSRLRHLFR